MADDKLASKGKDSLTRRDVLKGAAALAATGAGASLGCDAADAQAPSADAIGPLTGGNRLAIIGGGAGGIAAAYFLAGSFDVELFEARDQIGGHCDSHVIDYQGQPITVDLGAQFFHPDTHPIY